MSPEIPLADGPVTPRSFASREMSPEIPQTDEPVTPLSGELMHISAFLHYCIIMPSNIFIICMNLPGQTSHESARKSSGCCKYRQREGLSREEVSRLDHQRKTRAIDRMKKALWGKVSALEDHGIKCLVILEDEQRRRIQVGGSSKLVEKALHGEPVCSDQPEITVSRIDQSCSTRGRKRSIVFPSPQ